LDVQVREKNEVNSYTLISTFIEYKM